MSGKFAAAAISAVAFVTSSWEPGEEGNPPTVYSIFDCPPQTHTSPKSTPWMVVTLVFTEAEMEYAAMDAWIGGSMMLHFPSVTGASPPKTCFPAESVIVTWTGKAVGDHPHT
jgi:hypothetical protein